MEESDLVEIYAAAWRGLGVKFEGDPERAARVRDTYLHKLRTTGGSVPLRGVLVELLAEGLLAAGGHPKMRGESPALALWAEVKDDPGVRRVRDAALVAAAFAGGTHP